MVEEILRRLVAFDTRNPESSELPLLEYCAELLRRHKPDELELVKVPRPAGGASSGYLYASFGRPRLLVNAHADTVPLTQGWSGSPFELRNERGRLVGLGASDTKGSMAAFLAALEAGAPRDTAILISGDEERGNRAMTAFLAAKALPELGLAIVCEPTGGSFATEHRGILYAEITARGPGGHSSASDDLPAPALLLARVAARLGDWASEARSSGPALCLNIAEIKTGAAFNVIPTRATLVVSVRPAPGQRTSDVRAELERRAREVSSEIEVEFLTEHSSFRTLRTKELERWVGSDAPQSSVPFWTEAAFLAERGLNAVVYGPGDIGQAHRPDESIDVEALRNSERLFAGVYARTRA